MYCIPHEPTGAINARACLAIERRTYLDGLAMCPEDVNANYCFVQLWIRGLNNLVILMFFVVQRIEACPEINR